MEYLGLFGIVVVLNSPIYLMLFNIQRRLTKIEVLNGIKEK
jgi:hypothetical protein